MAGCTQEHDYDEAHVERILQNPKFKEMVSRKSRLSWTLTIIMLIVYVGFMLLVGYNKEFLMSSVGGGVIHFGYATRLEHYCIVFHFMVFIRILQTINWMH